MLVSGDLTVGTIAKETNMTIAATSKHLKVLLNAELVSQEKSGRHKFCKANFVKLKNANVWLSSIGLLDCLDVSMLEDFLSSEKML